MATDAVLVDQVGVSFGRVVALDGVDLAVPAGSILAVLGHNGAGKTTLIRVLTTRVRPDTGRVFVDGIDAIHRPGEVRRRIGVTGQYAGLDDFLTATENIELVGHLAGLGRGARHRTRDLIERLDLHELADRRVGELSGGSRRRIDLAASLVAAPAVLFLDEPTTGLDPTARQALWDVVTELTTAGTTVVLTTQYLEEADRLADQVVVLDHGRVAGRGSPAELKALIGGKIVRTTIGADRVDALPSRPTGIVPAGPDRVTASFRLADGLAAAELIGRLSADGIDVTDLDVLPPTLDDAFFHLAVNGAST